MSAHPKAEIPSRLNTAREIFAPLDMLGVPGAILRAPRGSKTPTRKHPVIVLPGFGASDISTAPLRYFLRRHGFRAEGWGLGINRAGRGLIQSLDDLSPRWNIDPSRTAVGEGEVPALVDAVIARVTERAEVFGSKVHLVGWSLGGYIAREVARDLPGTVQSLTTMGSPVIGGPKYSTVAPLFKARNVDLDYIEAEIGKRFETPITQPVTVIYSKRDGIVGWRASIDSYSPNAKNIEVNVSHLGLGNNAKVWDIVLGALQSADMPES